MWNNRKEFGANPAPTKKPSALFRILRAVLVGAIIIAGTVVAAAWGWILIYATLSVWPNVAIGQFLLVTTGFILWGVGIMLAAAITVTFCEYCFKDYG